VYRDRVRSLSIAAFFVAAAPHAHPGTGIVIDGRGNVFYTDLQAVWQIQPDGTKSIAVPDVHTHELMLDADGSLVGEDNEYLGNDRYRNRVWRRAANGSMSDVLPWRDGFWRQYGLTRDDRGTTYWPQCDQGPCVIRKREAGGRVAIVGRGVVFPPRTNHVKAGRDGSLFVVEENGIARIDPLGRKSTFAAKAGRSLMGMDIDRRSGDLYVASFGARTIVKITRDGTRSVVTRSPRGWSPSGVALASDGALWILEYSGSNAVRVRRVDAAGNSTIY
jgi:hypothetical protein